MTTRNFRKGRRGQVIVMVTLCLFVLCGILGLAVDLGWMYFVRKAAQSAADAAAIATVKNVMDNAVSLADYSCGGAVATCAATPVDCPGAPGNLQSACLYAAQNGFSAANPRRGVTVQASDRNTPPTVAGCNPLVHYPPTAPCVDTYYWATVRVREQVPQLFSAVLGHFMGTSAARATAAVARSEMLGSLILLNRQNDPWVEPLGINLRLYGTPVVHVPGGIFLASNTSQAGLIQGGGRVDSPSGTWIRGGGIDAPAGQWEIWPPTIQGDGPPFYDPMRSKNGQPPIYPNTTYIPVPIVSNKATLSSTNPLCSGGVCPPGNYYAAQVPEGCADPSCMIPTGDPIEIGGNVTFRGSSGTLFPTYVFFGGLTMGQSTVQFGPGEYVFAGVTDPSRTNVFNTDNKTLLIGGTGENQDPGRVLIFTDGSYEGRLNATKAGIPNGSSLPLLQFGNASVKSGNNAGSHVELYGLDKLDSTVIAAGLDEWAPVVMWQDQLNSNVKYVTDASGHSTGQIDITSCGPGHTLDNPCMNSPSPPPGYRELQVWATPYAKYGGVIYQPRGSWTWLQASGDYVGPLQLISGALKTTGSGNLTLTGPMIPTTVWVAALVE